MNSDISLFMNYSGRISDNPEKAVQSSLAPLNQARLSLKGNAKRKQKTVLAKLPATAKLKKPEFKKELTEWQHYYN